MFCPGYSDVSSRRTIQVDHVARIIRHDHPRAEFARERVEARDVPVGVGHAPRVGCQARGDIVRQLRAVVRQRNNSGDVPRCSV